MNEGDTFRVLSREPYYLVRKILLNDRWDRAWRETSYTHASKDIALLWKHGWRVREYMNECNRQGHTF